MSNRVDFKTLPFRRNGSDLPDRKEYRVGWLKPRPVWRSFDRNCNHPFPAGCFILNGVVTNWRDDPDGRYAPPSFIRNRGSSHD